MKLLLAAFALVSAVSAATNWKLTVPSNWVNRVGLNCSYRAGYSAFAVEGADGTAFAACPAPNAANTIFGLAGTTDGTTNCVQVFGTATADTVVLWQCLPGYSPFTTDAVIGLAGGAPARTLRYVIDNAGALDTASTACADASFFSFTMAAYSTSLFSVATPTAVDGANAAAVAASPWTCSPINCQVTCVSNPVTANGCRQSPTTTLVPFGSVVLPAGVTASQYFCADFYVNTATVTLVAGDVCTTALANQTIVCAGGAIATLDACPGCTLQQQLDYIVQFPAFIGPVITATTRAWIDNLICKLPALPADANGNGYIRTAACFIGLVPGPNYQNVYPQFFVWFRTLACYNGGRLPLNDAGQTACRFRPNFGGFLTPAFVGPVTSPIVNAVFISQVCPECDDGSKKGLLGLLGLLGIIPLLLCSLLCCLCLLCIRRRKTEGDVHFATFDAGAPACAEIPVHTATVHTATHVGPPQFVPHAF